MEVDFLVERREDRCIGTDQRAHVTVIGADAHMDKRRAIKGIGGASSQRVQWLRARLGDVNVYTRTIDGLVHVIVQREELQP